MVRQQGHRDNEQDLECRVIPDGQHEVLLADTWQWRLSDSPVSSRVSPRDIGRLCDLSAGEIHRILDQLAQVGYLEARLASHLDGYLVTVLPPSQQRG